MQAHPGKLTRTDSYTNKSKYTKTISGFNPAYLRGVQRLVVQEQQNTHDQSLALQAQHV